MNMYSTVHVSDEVTYMYVKNKIHQYTCTEYTCTLMYMYMYTVCCYQRLSHSNMYKYRPMDAKTNRKAYKIPTNAQ